MAALLTNAGTDDTDSVVVTGRCRVLVSGKFTNNAKVIIEVTADSLTKATYHVSNKREGFAMNTAASDTITATVKGGDTDTSIDVSVTAL